jgi:hypothetical protein
MTLARRKFNALKENPLLFAALISLVVHLAIFGGWKLNQRFGWLKNTSLPSWLQKLSRKILPEAPKRVVEQTTEPPLMFVDVDPQTVVKEAPKNTKFYGAANSKAASEKPRDNSKIPDVQGKQEKIVKTTEDSKAKPLQPSPAPAPKPDANDEHETKAKEKEKQIPGDLAFAKPEDQNKKSDSNEDQPEQKPRVRPRRLSDVNPSLRGEKMKQTGGAHVARISSMDVTLTGFGDYDREFIAAVQQRWYQLLEGRNTVPGKIVIEFKLLYDGRITDLKVAENTTHNPMLEMICSSAISDPAPYRKWPTEMRRELKTDSRDVRFTFYYE